VRIEWYFFAEDVENYRVLKKYALDSGSKDVALQPSGVESFDVTSKEVATKRSSSVSATQGTPDPVTGDSPVSVSTSNVQRGTKISGWVVRVLYNGKIADGRGSDSKYEEAAKDPDKFEALKAGKAY
jgi:hypothetical protein